MANTAYKFRLYPNADQRKKLESHLETLRHVYNAVLAYWNDKADEAFREGRKEKYPTDSEVYGVLKTLRNLQLEDSRSGGAGPHYLTQISAVTMRDIAMRVTAAFKRFFKIAKGEIKVPKPKKPRKDGRPTGYPRFKRYGEVRSLPFENTYPNGCVLRLQNGELAGDTYMVGASDRKNRFVRNVPTSRRGYRLEVFGVGKIKVYAHREIIGTIKTACIERDVDGKFYVVFVTEHAEQQVAPSTNPPAGIDVGIERFITDSDGNAVENPRILRANLKQLRRLQRSVSRKRLAAKRSKRKHRECNSLQRANQLVSRLHVRVRNIRKEFHHTTAGTLVGKYGVICAEKLNVLGMLKNSKLSRAIQDASWSGFLNVLRAKARKAGASFVEVDARYTSQTCPACGAVAKKKLSQRVHDCPCGYKTHRDHAAAQVILARGTGNAAGRVAVVRANDSIAVGMPPEQSGGERREQRKSDNARVSQEGRKPNRSRTRSKTPKKSGDG